MCVDPAIGDYPSDTTASVITVTVRIVVQHKICGLPGAIQDIRCLNGLGQIVSRRTRWSLDRHSVAQGYVLQPKRSVVRDAAHNRRGPIEEDVLDLVAIIRSHADDRR